MKRFCLLLFFAFCSPTITVAQETITLLTPLDHDTIETIYPMFNWFYQDLNLERNEVKYSFTLVELNEDQSAQAGILVNNPLVHIEDIQGFQYAYPFDAPELQYNHRYGWQMKQKINGVVTSESEAWEFILYKEVKIPMKYAVLNTDFNSTTYEVNDKGFFFKLNSKYKNIQNLQITVLNDQAQKMEVQLGEDEKLGEELELEKTADSFHFLKTQHYPAGVYTLLVKDQKGNVYNTRFKVQ